MSDDTFFQKVEDVLKGLVEVAKNLLESVNQNLPAKERKKLEEKQEALLSQLNTLTTQKDHQFSPEELKSVQKHLTSFQSFNQAYIDALSKEAKILDLD